MLGLGCVGALTTPAAAGTRTAGAARTRPARPAHAYAVVTATGQVATFGGAAFYGDLTVSNPSSRVVGMAATPNGHGYVLAERDGAVVAFGDAVHPAGPAPGPPTVAVAADPGTDGWYTVTVNGVVRATASSTISEAPVPAAAGPVVGIAAAGEHGAGAWVATANGVVVSDGTTPPIRPPDLRLLHDPGPVVGIAATPDGQGYWLATSSGAAVAAGDAATFGATPGAPTGGRPGTASNPGRATARDAPAQDPPDPAPVTGLMPTPDGRGALLVRSDGAVGPLGDAVYSGDAVSPLHPPLYPRQYQLPPTEAVGGAYLAAGPQTARRGPLRVTFLGDSLSVILGRDTRQYVGAHHLAVTVTDGGILGCGVVGALDLAVYSHHYPLSPTLPACAQWSQQYRRTVALAHPDVVVLLLGYWESQRHFLPGHGAVTVADSAAYRRYLTAQFRAVRRLVGASGASLVVATAPYFGDGTPDANVDDVNQLLRSDFPAATPFDLGQLLDPAGRYTSEVDGVRVRGADRVHLTAAAVEQVIDPALVPVLTTAADTVRSGDG
jgi:hypothetical protein